MEERTNVSRDKDQAVESPSIFPSSDADSDSRRLSVKVVRQARAVLAQFVEHFFHLERSEGRSVVQNMKLLRVKVRLPPKLPRNDAYYQYREYIRTRLLVFWKDENGNRRCSTTPYKQTMEK